MKYSVLTICALILCLNCKTPITVNDAGISAVNSPPVAPSISGQYLVPPEQRRLMGIADKRKPVLADARTQDCVSQQFVDGWVGLKKCLSGMTPGKLGIFRPPPNPVSWLVPAWFLDRVNGNNNFTCVDAAHPCADPSEIRARWETMSPHHPQDTTITYLSTINTDADVQKLYWVPYLDNGAAAIVTAPLPTPIATGTLSGVSGPTVASNALLQATLTGGLSTGEIVFNTTSPSAAWLYKNISGNIWSLNTPETHPSVTGNWQVNATEVAWNSGDSFVVYPQFIDVSFGDVGCQPAGSDIRGGMYVYHVNIRGPVSGQGLGMRTWTRMGESSASGTLSTMGGPALDANSMSIFWNDYFNNELLATGGTQDTAGNLGESSGSFIYGGIVKNGLAMHAGVITNDLVVGNFAAIKDIGVTGLYLDTTTGTSGSGTVGTHFAGKIHLDFSIWGPGGFTMEWGYIEHKNTAAQDFPTSGGIFCDINNNGWATAYDFTKIGSPIFPNRTLSAAQLDLSTAAGGFGGIAYCNAGGVFVPVPLLPGSPTNYITPFANGGTNTGATPAGGTVLCNKSSGGATWVLASGFPGNCN